MDRFLKDWCIEQRTVPTSNGTGQSVGIKANLVVGITNPPLLTLQTIRASRLGPSKSRTITAPVAAADGSPTFHSRSKLVVAPLTKPQRRYKIPHKTHATSPLVPLNCYALSHETSPGMLNVLCKIASNHGTSNSSDERLAHFKKTPRHHTSLCHGCHVKWDKRSLGYHGFEVGVYRKRLGDSRNVTQAQDGNALIFHCNDAETYTEVDKTECNVYELWVEDTKHRICCSSSRDVTVHASEQLEFEFVSQKRRVAGIGPCSSTESQLDHLQLAIAVTLFDT
ncbi:uncharacterized protein BJ212DRAFT_1550410 [Suillus subaureus]|uniref:Uncharacterized protein n=1 Tax=Suillus subaureus TaxID=48587 RepID=A0A9P7EGC9_9AGAM|nr:uncharacterized protein BJ212DRAFT_1550410 [Suillus subaureus]KAG1821046.1 hypothetical protein BJ212DRAFT_1550410 [Suillus subaureus]